MTVEGPKVNREVYIAQVETMDFSDRFAGWVDVEQSATKLPLLSIFGRALFSSLEDQGLLEPFGERSYPKVRKGIRTVLELSCEGKEVGSDMTIEDFMGQIFLPNKKWIVGFLKARLCELFDSCALEAERDAALASVDASRVVLEEHIARISEALRQAAKVAMKDKLTELGSRHAFELKMQSIRETQPNEPYTVLFLDLDHFKKVNDERGGHDKGDEVLKTVARIIEKFTRDECAFRFGGEEIVIMFAGDNENRAIHGLAEPLRLAIQAHEFRTPDGQPFNVTASMGVAFGKGEELSLEASDSLVGRADAALYAAKGTRKGFPDDPKGRNRICVAGKKHPEPRSDEQTKA